VLNVSKGKRKVKKGKRRRKRVARRSPKGKVEIEEVKRKKGGDKCRKRRFRENIGKGEKLMIVGVKAIRRV
jgi:hypothetical protein